MLEDSALERRELELHEIDSPQSVPDFDSEPNARPSSPQVEARAPVRPKSLPPERPTQPQEGQPVTISKKPSKGVRRGRPVVFAIGAMLLAAAVGGGYVYLDYDEHFQSTDDAFIAARQSALAPKVAGYITAVPVTDNEHVAASDVIARIDDRDYRTALGQAEAQVAAAQANIENIDAQLQVQ